MIKDLFGRMFPRLALASFGLRIIIEGTMSDVSKAAGSKHGDLIRKQRIMSFNVYWFNTLKGKYTLCIKSSLPTRGGVKTHVSPRIPPHN